METPAPVNLAALSGILAKSRQVMAKVETEKPVKQSKGSVMGENYDTGYDERDEREPIYENYEAPQGSFDPTNVQDYTEEQAFAYIDKKYGKQYGDLLRFAKSANDVKNSGQKVTKNTKNFYKSVSADRAATNYKDIVTNTEKLAKNTGKTIDYGNQVASDQSVVGNVGNVMNNIANAANKSIAKV